MHNKFNCSLKCFERFSISKSQHYIETIGLDVLRRNTMADALSFIRIEVPDICQIYVFIILLHQFFPFTQWNF